MILIDAANVTIGGGKVLLEYLVEYLIRNQYEFRVICNRKYVFNDPDKSYEKYFLETTSPGKRKSALRRIIKKISATSLLCFGNYPPPKKFDIKTVTYFHNPYLLENPLLNIGADPKLFLKKLYLKKHLMNTDVFIFQTALIKQAFAETYGKAKTMDIRVIPFYNAEKILSAGSAHPKENQFVYISLPHPHKNHKRLLQAWKILAKKNLFPRLILTIPDIAANRALIQLIHEINISGGQINNLGEISHADALIWTAKSKYVIFPSLKETFGLGLVEAALLDCYVLAADLPYVIETIRPTLIFNPSKPDEIADRVEECISSKVTLNKSQLVAENGIEKLVDLLN